MDIWSERILIVGLVIFVDFAHLAVNAALGYRNGHISTWNVFHVYMFGLAIRPLST